MEKNASQEPIEMEMSIFTFTHDYYILQLPPKDQNHFYSTFPIYKDKLNFKGQQIREAPVVRIYGTNDSNQKCCCHVHGYFPFIYVKAEEYEQALKESTFLIEFLLKVESVYQQAFQTNKCIIYQAQLQYKYDFYGYHTHKEAFLKIYLYDPSFVFHMRDLLNSKILGNKSFQCYEAHINYYMQFFSDFNIYGINEMKICGFTFRKNLKIMPLFEKLSSNLLEGIVHRGWNLEYLQEKRPECFNSLYKMSCCYIEIDFDFHSILNAYQAKDSEGENHFQCESSDEETLKKTEGLRKIQVNVTKALEQIWRDQKKRRNRFQIRKTLEGVIDLSKNIESTSEVEEGNKDALWINFIGKGQNGPQFLRMVKSYISSRDMPQKRQLRIDMQSCQNYKQILAKQRQQLLQKVQARSRFYDYRKNKILSEIKSGDRGELPEWSDDEQQKSNASSNSEQSEKSQIGDFDYGHKKVQTKSYAIQNLGNTVKYRNNFKFELANFKSDSLFATCKFCRQKNFHCECVLCQICGEESCECPEKVDEKPNHNDSWTIKEFDYTPLAPSLGSVMDSRVVVHEKPFYSKVEDLYQHYKVSSAFPVSQTMSQLMQKQLKNTYFFNREPITIANSQRLPYFFKYTKSQVHVQFEPTTYELQYCKASPSFQEVLEECLGKKRNNMHTNRMSSNKYEDTFVADLIVMSYELLVEIEENNLYYGNPEKHPIYGIVLQIYNERAPFQSIRAALITKKYTKNLKDLFSFDQVLAVESQQQLLSLLICIVFKVDVDLFMSWDMEKKGLRYLLQRGITNGINLAACLSRVNDLEDMFEHVNFTDFQTLKQTYLKRQYLIYGNVKDQFEANPTKDNKHYLNILNEKMNKKLQKKPIYRQKYKFDMEIKGRININLCRLCQELKIISYSLQYVVMHLFQTQISEFTDKQLCKTAANDPSSALQYMLKRIEYQKLITHQMNIIGGIVEKSKVYGADFLSMMERGSQFKIESIMCRTAKQNDYLTLSATKIQVANQSVLLCRPLVIEPPKQFYPQPVLLFDFQSLYPSVMIAYNLCYSTCLGSIKELFKEGKTKKIGVNADMTMHLDLIADLVNTSKSEQQLIDILSNHVLVTPNKVAFVRKNMKEGFIPKILLQFLISRIMIKNSAKLYSKESIKKLLKERQIALKMFMNVLFGYTGASFTGRMPCSEIADSVVEISKYCLRKSIDYLNSHPVYKGKVIYGDTDSIFFHLPNYRVSQTFDIGKTLADQITKMFPYPMEMKFQKVYESLFLVSKKRYYGKSYQTKDSAPKYEGKGVQTVRRDGIPFLTKAMTKILNELIDSKDLSKMKDILYAESRRLLQGQVNVKELCLAKEVKMLKYSQKYLPAHGAAAKRLQNIDPMLLPKYGERLKYVVVEGMGSIRKRAIPIFEYMLKKQKYKLDFDYYYNHLFLPPLRRTLISLINLDEWGTLNEQSRGKNKEEQPEVDTDAHQRHNKQAKGSILCLQCLDQQMQSIERQCEGAEKVCRQCVGEKGLKFEQCVEWNCANLYNRRKARQAWNGAKQRGQQLKLIVKILGL